MRGRHRANRHSQIDVYNLLVAHDWHSSPRYPVITFRSWLAAESILMRPTSRRQMSPAQERAALDVQYAAQIILAGLGGMLAAATITAGIAKADPALDQYTVVNAPIVCAMLSQTSSEAGVEYVVGALHDKGLTFEQAGEVVARSVIGWCPSEMPEVRAFVAKWTTSGTVRA